MSLSAKLSEVREQAKSLSEIMLLPCLAFVP